MKSSDYTLHISAGVSNPHEITEDIEDISQDILDSYAEIIITTMNPDVKQVAWNYLNKLAENKRLWNHDKIWTLLDIANKIRQKYFIKLKEILGSPNGVWDSYHRDEIKQILKGVTEPKERCKIWWEAWKSCAKGIIDTTEYTHLTQSISVEVENSNRECKDSIRLEQLSIIESDDPPYFAQRAKQLQI